MIIRCPQCEHTRSINESKIPPTAELATCPKCKHRFRFRTLRHLLESPPPLGERSAPSRSFSPPPGQEVFRPQSAVREQAEREDIWDAVDALHERWQARLDQHVTEVEHPGRPEKEKAPEPTSSDRGKNAAPPRLDQKAEAPEAAPSGISGEVSAAPAEKEAALSQERSPKQSPEQPSEQPSNRSGDRSGDRFGDQSGPASVPQSDDTSCAPFAPHPDAAPGLAHSPDEPGPKDPKKAMPIAFPYADGGAKPEERVEQDMQMLLQEPASRPSRDLGKLRELSDQETPDDASPDEEREIPWENPAKYGWIRGFMRTIRGVMFNAPVFFSGIRPEGSLAPGYLFFLALGYLSIIATVAWGHVAALLLPGIAPLPGAPMALPVLLLLAPVALGLMLLFVTGLIRVVVSLFAPEKAVFPVIYRIVSYSVAPFILSLVPFVGPGLGALWFLASLALGCRHGLGLSWGLALGAPFFPAVALLGGLAWYFL